jgi:hypothetical protein
MAQRTNQAEAMPRKSPGVTAALAGEPIRISFVEGVGNVRSVHSEVPHYFDEFIDAQWGRTTPVLLLDVRRRRASYVPTLYFFDFDHAFLLSFRYTFYLTKASIALLEKTQMR